MRGTANISNMVHLVGRGVDEGDRVRPDRDDGDRTVIGREAHAMDKDLPFVERTEITWRGIAKADDAEQRVAGWIDHGDRVGELIRGVNAVMGAERYVGRAGAVGCLPSECRRQPTNCGARGKRGGEESVFQGVLHDYRSPVSVC